MKCEICHKSEAETAVSVTRNGEARELYVCRKCAASIGGGKSGSEKSASRRKGKVTVTRIDASDDPPPFLRDFIEATMGLMKGISDGESHMTCKTCHSTWDKIKERGRLGCPNCWKTFSKEIQEGFLKLEYGRTHLGPPPAAASPVAADSAVSRAWLERELKSAVAREDYRRAEEVKRLLDAMSADGGKDGR